MAARVERKDIVIQYIWAMLPFPSLFSSFARHSPFHVTDEAEEAKEAKEAKDLDRDVQARSNGVNDGNDGRDLR
jgi:hypothetical protein